ncbi:MAG: hypothetical protein HFE53_09780 [Turicibacter sp.]|uniref:hypothetical protein n=1 Tax=Turicibacter sp. KK003 TaxID=3114695 RepID=UPI002171622F|nr:hypothetical protein [Turicibacter sp.]
MKKRANIHKVLIRVIVILMIGLGAIGIYSRYPQMRERAIKMTDNFYESYMFLWNFSEGIYSLDSVLKEGEASQFYTLSQSWQRDYQKDMDYYLKQGDEVLEHKGDQLAELLTEGAAEKTDDLSAYQYVLALQFDGEGQLTIKKIIGASSTETRQRLEGYLSNYPTDIKDTTMVFGVHQSLSKDGLLNHKIENYLGGEYLQIVVVYLVSITLIVLVIVFILPFSWFEELATVRGLLLVPLELRFIFVIVTAIASAFAPLLVVLTQAHQWTQLIDPALVHWINLICWGGFIAVVLLHALYVKEFFVIGPWQMIRQHTILGQLVYFWTRPKVVVETETVEKVIFKEDPRVDLMVSRLELLKETLTRVKHSVENTADIENVAVQIESLLKLCALNRPKTTVNLTKLISDTLVQLEQEYIPLEVKLRFPEKTVSIQANEEDLKLLMDSLLMGIATSALQQTRVYLQLAESEDLVVFTTRSVIRSEVNETWPASLNQLAEYMDAQLEVVIDGDLLKMDIAFKK